MPTPSSSAFSPTPGGVFQLRHDLPIHRLGLWRDAHHRATGVWGRRRTAPRPSASCAARWTSASTSSTPPTATARTSARLLIAEALHPYPAGLVIATKGGSAPHRPRPVAHGRRPEHLKEACEGSLKRLKLDCIDLYQFHRPDPTVPFEDSIGAMAELQQEGKIRHVGLSNVTVEQLDAAQKIVPIVSVQNRYNLKDRASEAVLKACEAQGIALHALRAAPARRRTRCSGRSTRWPAVRGGVTDRAGGARLAAGAFARDAAHPRHRLGGPPGGKHGGRRAGSCSPDEMSAVEEGIG